MYGAEIWTLSKVDKKYLESFEMCCWGRMEKVSLNDSMSNEKVLNRLNEQRNILHRIK